ncbi:MAG: MCE family protein [Xanthomonadaceae bacterium]|nr:MCE family protein [Xanthomonadaceae bacterium]
MEAKAKYMLVGSTVSILSILLVVAMIWISEVGGHKDTRKYTIYFEKYSLAGLQVDSAVTMKGISVGNVTKLKISPNNIEQVKVIIELNTGTPVKRDTEAVIDRNLLTGLAHIDLINSHQEADLLNEIPPGENFPVIPEGQAGLETMITATLPNLLANVDTMVHNANEMFSPENRQLLQEMLLDISAATKKLSASQAKLSDLLNEATELAGESRTVVHNLDQRAAAVEKSVTETIGILQEKITSVTPLIMQLQSTAGNLNEAVSGSASTIALEVEYLTEELVKTAQQVSDTLDEYKNPREIILGPDRSSLGPGEGEKQ